ncbi:hypothetical protein D3C74_481600 [compost metagenome]
MAYAIDQIIDIVVILGIGEVIERHHTALKTSFHKRKFIARSVRVKLYNRTRLEQKPGSIQMG